MKILTCISFCIKSWYVSWRFSFMGPYVVFHFFCYSVFRLKNNCLKLSRLKITITVEFTVVVSLVFVYGKCSLLFPSFAFFLPYYCCRWLLSQRLRMYGIVVWLCSWFIRVQKACRIYYLALLSEEAASVWTDLTFSSYSNTTILWISLLI